MDILTVPNDSRVGQISYFPKYSAVCSIGKAAFYGNLEIVYRPTDRLLEFESFEKWLNSLALTETTVEGLCRMVFDALSVVLGGVTLRVTVNANTTVHSPVSATIERET